ncbi:hypothetical protein ACRRTK_008248 [Alexandromys fortis]
MVIGQKTLCGPGVQELTVPRTASGATVLIFCTCRDVGVYLLVLCSGDMTNQLWN